MNNHILIVLQMVLNKVTAAIFLFLSSIVCCYGRGKTTYVFLKVVDTTISRSESSFAFNIRYYSQGIFTIAYKPDTTKYFAPRFKTLEQMMEIHSYVIGPLKMRKDGNSLLITGKNGQSHYYLSDTSNLFVSDLIGSNDFSILNYSTRYFGIQNVVFNKGIEQCYKFYQESIRDGYTQYRCLYISTQLLIPVLVEYFDNSDIKKQLYKYVCQK